MKKPSKTFGNALLKWHKNIDRQMPWKDTSNPYHIWISEIILQQTRVAQGLKYFHNFIETFPTVQSLAEATEDEVLSVWKGLGYYSRARNLHHAAKTVVVEYQGQFPDSYSDILSLKGIGPYSAAAISSFAFNLPYAVVDGNVFRVLSRVFGKDNPIDSTEGKKCFADLAQDLLGNHAPALYNQAIMDFGALVCTSKSPRCDQCPLQKKCFAYSNDQVHELPVKSKKLKVRKRYFHYFIIINENRILLRRRPKGDIWQGLYEPPLIEAKAKISNKELNHKASLLLGHHIPASNLSLITSASQKLTHQNIQASFYHLDLDLENEAFEWRELESLKSLAMPKVVDDYLGNM